MAPEKIQTLCNEVILNSLASIDITFREGQEGTFYSLIKDHADNFTEVPKAFGHSLKIKLPKLFYVETLLGFLENITHKSASTTILTKTLLSYLATLACEGEDETPIKDLKEKSREEIFQNKNFVMQMKVAMLILTLNSRCLIQINHKSPVIMKELARLFACRKFSFFSASVLNILPTSNKALRNLKLVEYEAEGFTGAKEEGIRIVVEGKKPREETIDLREEAKVEANKDIIDYVKPPRKRRKVQEEDKEDDLPQLDFNDDKKESNAADQSTDQDYDGEQPRVIEGKQRVVTAEELKKIEK